MGSSLIGLEMRQVKGLMVDNWRSIARRRGSSSSLARIFWTQNGDLLGSFFYIEMSNQKKVSLLPLTSAILVFLPRISQSAVNLGAADSVCFHLVGEKVEAEVKFLWPRSHLVMT